MSRDARRFFTTLGGAGNYFDRASINLLDADTANLQQSIGDWQPHTGATNFGLSLEATTLFGNFGLRWEASSTATAGARNTGNTNSGTPALGSTQYAFSVWTGSDDRLLTVIIRQFDAGGATLLNTTIASAVSAPLPNGVIARGVITTEPTTAFLHLHILGLGAGSAGDAMFASDNLFALGSDWRFVPSFRIVGDIYMVARGAPTSWAPGGGSTFDQELIVNSDLSSDGYRLFIQNDGQITAYHGNGTITRAEGLNPDGLVDGVAAEIAVWYNVTAGDAKWYQDGLQVATDTFAAGAAVPHDDPLRVASLDGTLRPFLGDFYYAAVHDGGPGSPIVARYDALHAFDKAESNGSLIPDGSVFRDDTGLGEWTSHGASVIGLRDRKWDS